MARISLGRAWPSRMSLARRWVSTVVLPVPAPATTSMGPAMCSTASLWRGLSSKAGAEGAGAENNPSCEDETSGLRPAGIDWRGSFILWGSLRLGATEIFRAAQGFKVSKFLTGATSQGRVIAAYNRGLARCIRALMEGLP